MWLSLWVGLIFARLSPPRQAGRSDPNEANDAYRKA